MAHLGDTMNPMSSPSAGGQMIGPMKSITGPGTGLGLGSGALEFKKWGDTTSKIGENSRIFIGNVDFKNTSCDNIGTKSRRDTIKINFIRLHLIFLIF